MRSSGNQALDSVTKMIKDNDQTKTQSADQAFGNLVSSNLSQLPKRLKLSCQNEIHSVMFKYLMEAENTQQGQVETTKVTSFTDLLNSTN